MGQAWSPSAGAPKAPSGGLLWPVELPAPSRAEGWVVVAKDQLFFTIISVTPFGMKQHPVSSHSWGNMSLDEAALMAGQAPLLVPTPRSRGGGESCISPAQLKISATGRQLQSRGLWHVNTAGHHLSPYSFSLGFSWVWGFLQSSRNTAQCCSSRETPGVLPCGLGAEKTHSWQRTEGAPTGAATLCSKAPRINQCFLLSLFSFYLIDILGCRGACSSHNKMTDCTSQSPPASHTSFEAIRPRVGQHLPYSDTLQYSGYFNTPAAPCMFPPALVAEIHEHRQSQE